MAALLDTINASMTKELSQAAAAWLESGMVGTIYAQDSRDGRREVEFTNGKAATIRPFDLSSWEAL
jgi:hypothetical protein